MPTSSACVKHPELRTRLKPSERVALRFRSLRDQAVLNVKAIWSNYGNLVDFAAPGVGIWTTARGNNYGSVSGTSFASPTTAAVAALVMATKPTLLPPDVEAVLQNSADDLGTAGWRAESGRPPITADREPSAPVAYRHDPNRLSGVFTPRPRVDRPERQLSPTPAVGRAAGRGSSRPRAVIALRLKNGRSAAATRRWCSRYQGPRAPFNRSELCNSPIGSAVLCGVLPISRRAERALVVTAAIEDAEDGHLSGATINFEGDDSSPPKVCDPQTRPHVVALGPAQRKGRQTLAVLHDGIRVALRHRR